MALNHHAGPEAVYQALRGRLPWTDPVFVDAITTLSRYYQAGWWGGSVEDYFTNSFPRMYAALAAGRAAFMITGSWASTEVAPYFGEAAGNSATWEWAPLFPLRAGVPDIVWDLGIGRTLSINANADKPDETAAYLNFLESDPRRQADGIAEVGMQPAPIELTAADFPPGADAGQVRARDLRVQRAEVAVRAGGQPALGTQLAKVGQLPERLAAGQHGGRPGQQRHRRRWHVIYCGLFSPFATLLLRSFLFTIARELEEAARIDGAGEPRLLLPVAAPGFLTFALVVRRARRHLTACRRKPDFKSPKLISLFW